MIDLENLRTQKALFNYLSPVCGSSSDKPYRLFGIPSTPDVPETNIVLVTHEVTIHDLRGHESRLSLERDAFQLVQWPHDIISSATPEGALNYAEDMASQLQHETKADKVFVIDSQVGA